MPRIEHKRSFSKSLIWKLQRDYFNEVGIDAWRTGEVPHYLTSNPVVGRTYAELVLAFLRDLSLKKHRQDPVYLIELGAGHGRLCYHFFKHFERYYDRSTIPLPSFCYVLSDFTATNLAFWQDHPRLQPYLGKDWLDFAQFDAETDTEIFLQRSQIVLKPQSLAQPLIAIANYFFDTIPQDLFAIEAGTIFHTLLSLSTEADPAELSAANLLATIDLRYDYEAAGIPIYPEPTFNTILECYRQHFCDRTHIFFPHIGLRCLERLRQLSQRGLVLLTADKGEHHLSNWSDRSAPQLVTHGSFSLIVNYHAFEYYCRLYGGLSLFPRHQQAGLDLGCLLFLDDADTYWETINAYDRFVSDYGPDDYFSLKKLVEANLRTLSDRDILAIVRLSGYDARIFQQMLPRLFELLPDITDNQCWNLYLAIPRIWDTYYPLGEVEDLATNLGDLLLALAFYSEAPLYYEKSIAIYGKTAEVLYRIAICHYELGEFPAATELLEALLAGDPDNEAFQQLKQAIDTES